VARVRDRDRALVRERREKVAIVFLKSAPASATAQEQDPLELPPHPEGHAPLEARFAESFQGFPGTLGVLDLREVEEGLFRRDAPERRGRDRELLKMPVGEAAHLLGKEDALAPRIGEEDCEPVLSELPHDAQAEEIQCLVQVEGQVQGARDLEEVSERDDLELEL